MEAIEATSGLTDLARIQHLAREQVVLEDRVEHAKKHLANLERMLDAVRRAALPEAMIEVGMTEIKLDTGEGVKLVERIHANISAERRETANQWLDSHGHGGLIKTTVEVPFGRDQRNDALVLRDRLTNDGLDVAMSEKIHPSTLAAFAREALAGGLLDDEAMTLLGVHVSRETKIIKPASHLDGELNPANQRT